MNAKQARQKNDLELEEDDIDNVIECSDQYIIQTWIINNSNLEVNLEIILKLTTFAGN